MEDTCYACDLYENEYGPEYGDYICTYYADDKPGYDVVGKCVASKCEFEYYLECEPDDAEACDYGAYGYECLPKPDDDTLNTCKAPPCSSLAECQAINPNFNACLIPEG